MGERPEDVQRYVDEIPTEHRLLFDRVDRLVREACPDASLSISYRMPTYRVGAHRLYVGVWRHGVSLYGWRKGGDGGFSERHPEVRSGKGTIRLRSEHAASIPDAELRALASAVLSD